MDLYCLEKTPSAREADKRIKTSSEHHKCTPVNHSLQCRQQTLQKKQERTLKFSFPVLWAASQKKKKTTSLVNPGASPAPRLFSVMDQRHVRHSYTTFGTCQCTAFFPSAEQSGDSHGSSALPHYLLISWHRKSGLEQQ